MENNNEKSNKKVKERWSEQETGILIEERIKLEHLFSAKEYIGQRKALWLKVQEAAGLENKELMHIIFKWDNLMRRYKIVETELLSNSGHIENVQWVHFEKLHTYMCRKHHKPYDLIHIVNNNQKESENVETSSSTILTTPIINVPDDIPFDTPQRNPISEVNVRNIQRGGGSSSISNQTKSKRINKRKRSSKRKLLEMIAGNLGEIKKDYDKELKRSKKLDRMILQTFRNLFPHDDYSSFSESD